MLLAGALFGLVVGLLVGFVWGWKARGEDNKGEALWSRGWEPWEAAYCTEHEMVEGAGGAMRWCKWCPFTEHPRDIHAKAPVGPTSTPSPAQATPLAGTPGAFAGEAPAGTGGHVRGRGYIMAPTPIGIGFKVAGGTERARAVCPGCGHVGYRCVCSGRPG